MRSPVNALFPILIAGAMLAPHPLAAEEAGGGADVLAHYGDLRLTTSDLFREIEGVKSIRNPSGTPDRQVVFTLVDHLLLRKILAEEAAAADLIPEDELAARLERQKEMWLAEARMEALADALSEAQLEAAAREMYVAHPEDYRSKERIDTSHILIRKRAEGRDEDASQALAREIHQQLVEDPSRFEALVTKYSEDDKTAEEGGSVGWRDAERLVKPYREAALALEPGEITEPVESRFGFHIIRLEGHEPEKLLPFEEIKPALMAQAEKQARATAIQTYLAKLKMSEDFVYDEGAVEQVYRERFAGGRLIEPAE